jgi:broad specificity phosphatase PhoE
MNNLFLRHGEVQNLKNIQYGSLPGYFLSEKGLLQAKKIGKLIKKDYKIKKIISSPLLRARETALAVNESLGLDITYSQNLTEWPGVYNWHGLTIEEIKLTADYKSYNEKSITLIKTKEPLEKVYERVFKLFSNNTDTLFISHQDTIRAFTYFYLKDENFSINRPDHCELQLIKNQNILSMTV